MMIRAPTATRIRVIVTVTGIESSESRGASHRNIYTGSIANANRNGIASRTTGSPGTTIVLTLPCLKAQSFPRRPACDNLRGLERRVCCVAREGLRPPMR